MSSKDEPEENNRLFSSFSLATWIVDGLESLSHDHASTVQQRLLPLLLNNHNVLVQDCKPCTGKTTACLSAALQLVDWDRPHTQALCLVPTRELARYLYDVVVQLRKHDPVRALGCSLVVGGKRSQSAPEIPPDECPQLVVATVGRLHEMAQQGELSLQQVRFVLLDEADDLLPSSQVESLWTFLPMQAIAWAVTCIRISPTVQQFIDTYLTPSERTITLNDGPYVRSPVEHLWVAVKDRGGKLDLLQQVCEVLHVGRVLVFCSAAYQKFLHAHFQKSYPTFVQHQRNVVEYMSGDARILVTTDVLARGVHLEDVCLVVNVNLPPDLVTYLQRAGRGSGLNLQRHLVVLSLLEAEDVPKLPRLESFCNITVAEVSAERAILHCGLMSSLVK